VGERGVFDLSYFYDADSRLIAAQVLSVPRSWVVTPPAGRTQTLVLATDADADHALGCVVVFSLRDPLRSYVIPWEREEVAGRLVPPDEGSRRTAALTPTSSLGSTGAMQSIRSMGLSPATFAGGSAKRGSSPSSFTTGQKAGA